MIEKNQPETWPTRDANTLAPAAATSLQQLGLWDAFLAQGFVANPGVQSCWNSNRAQVNDCFYSSWGPGWRVERRQFDHWLVTETSKRGIDYWAPWEIHGAEKEGTGWKLSLGLHQQGLAMPGDSQQKAQRQLRAGFLIDASGRQASLATRLGARRLRHDRLLSALLLAPLAPEQDPTTWIEALPHGWWYSTPVSEQELLLCFFTDTDLARTLNLSHEAGWRAQLAAGVWTSQRIRGAWRNPKPQIRPAHSQSLSPVAGEDWLAVGDAASSMDPLSSFGLLKALNHATLAAQVCSLVLNGTERQPGAASWRSPLAHQALNHYRTQLGLERQQDLARRQQYYSLETRYSHYPFWQRRIARPDSTIGLGGLVQSAA